MNLFITASFFSVSSAILLILGSLGIFLYGMKVLSEGVQKVAGDKMRVALATMTGNRVKGVLTGLFTTTLVQSSSATTVLVVSFVNAGLLTLVQSIGLIMGANLGTTTTAWIVAMIGKFDVAKVALPVVGIGLPLFFIGKDKLKYWGETLIGFGLVFLGLGLLKDAVPDVRTLMKTDPGTAEMIQGVIAMINGHGFGSILLFLAAGVILTLTVQSSSAAMAITVTCALNGWLGDIHTNPIGVFYNSAAIVLGENIGTTVTAWLAALGASTNARRAARAHFAFNVIGCIWAIALFYPFANLVWWLAGKLPASMKGATEAMAKSEVAFGTAIFHSSFNLMNICLLIWFVPQIAKLVTKWVKEPEGSGEEKKLRFMSSTLVDTGTLSLAEAESAVRIMAKQTSEMFDGVVDVLSKPEQDLSEKVKELKKMEDEADVMLHDITSYLIHCSSHEIADKNATRIAVMLRIVSELESATDRIYRLMKLIQRKHQKGYAFDSHHNEELAAISSEVRSLLTVACSAVETCNHDMLTNAETIESRINKLRKANSKAAAERLKAGADVQKEMLFIDINSQFEAVGNHSLNVMHAHRV